jgi:hypothetical protein
MTTAAERENERIHGKLDKLADGVTRLTTLEEGNAKILPQMAAQLIDHETRLGKVEQHNWARLDQRIDELEQWKSTMKGWIMGATAVVTVMGGIVLYFLQDVLAHLPG